MWVAIKKGAKTELKAGLVFQEIFSYIKASSVHITCTVLRHLLCMSWLAHVAVSRYFDGRDPPILTPVPVYASIYMCSEVELLIRLQYMNVGQWRSCVKISRALRSI